MKMIESRVLEIANFRNLGPFYTGKREDLALLKLNRSLNRDEIGGVIALVGANNTGKSNLLAAVNKAANGGIDDNDCTDFVYTDKQKPTLRFDVAHGRYGFDDWKLQPEVAVSGTMPRIMSQILKMRESYYLYRSITGAEISVKDYVSKVDAFIVQLQELQPMEDVEVFVKVFQGRRDIRGWDRDRARERLLNNQQAIVNEHGTIYSHGKPLDDCSAEDLPKDYKTFEEVYGYTLSNRVFMYSPSAISGRDLMCEPRNPNQFFKNLLKIIGVDQKAIQNSYAGAGNLRTKLEDDINGALVKVADELNQILNINQKKYRFCVRLERGSMEFTISYGNDVPLNIDRQSEGFRWLFNFYFNLVKVETFLPGDIVVLDEFGSTLSFGTTRELVDNLRAYARRQGLTIILATHNPMVVDIMRLDEVRLMVPRDDGSSVVVNQFDQFGQENHDVLEPILDGLTVNRNFMRSENRRTVFVEGATDYFYFNAFSRVLRGMGEKVDVDFIPINGLGDSESRPEQTLGKLRSIERDVVILTDGDRAGARFSKVAAKTPGVTCFTIAELFKDAKKEVEDLFSEEDRRRYGVDEKSFDRAATFSQHVEEIYPQLEEETRRNFRTIIDYVVSG